MKLIAKASSDDRPLCPAGMQQGILYSIIVLGTQETEYMSKVKKQFKFNVSWELPHLPKLEYEDNGEKILRPQCIFKSYTNSLYVKSNLAQDLAGWRGKEFNSEEERGFDVFTIFKAGANALLNITHYEGGDGKMRAKYISISPLMPGMSKMIPENRTVEYEPSMLDNFPEGMPDWARDSVVKSPEYKAAKHPDLQANGYPVHTGVPEPDPSITESAYKSNSDYVGDNPPPPEDEDFPF